MKTDHTRLRITLGLSMALIASVLGVAGCSQASGSSSIGDPAAAPKTEVERIAADHCSGCHSAAKALSWTTSSKSDAKKLIESMTTLGSSPSEKDQELLIDYFTR